MAQRVKLAELTVRETSGVDHPAHLHEGWMVIKEAVPTTNTTEGATVELEVTQTEENVAEVDAAPADNQTEALVKELGDLRKELANMRTEKAALEAQRELEKATERAHGFAILPGLDPAEFGAVLLDIRKAAPEAAEKIEAVLEASAIALGEANITKEAGTDAAPEVTADAWAKIESFANDLVAKGEATSFAKAISMVAERDKDLYTAYLTEKGL
jgi:hypothetical protein